MSRRKDVKEHLLERPDEEQPLAQPPQDPFKNQYTSEPKRVLPTTSPEVSQHSVEGTTARQLSHIKRHRFRSESRDSLLAAQEKWNESNVSGSSESVHDITRGREHHRGDSGRAYG